MWPLLLTITQPSQSSPKILLFNQLVSSPPAPPSDKRNPRTFQLHSERAAILDLYSQSISRTIAADIITNNSKHTQVEINAKAK